MQAVREIATGKVLYLFDDTKKVTITQAGLVTPLRALDIKPDTHDVVDAPLPPVDFAGGKLAFDGEWRIIETKYARDIKHAQLSKHRWEKETGGLDLPSGQRIQTTREAQAQISSTYSSLKDGLVSAADWKAQNGWVSVTLTEFQPIAQAVADHVQRCFSAEKAVGQQIDAATTVDELAQIDLAAAFSAAYAA